MYLGIKRRSKGRIWEHSGQDALLAADFLCLGCPNGLLKDACQVGPPPLLGPEVALWPVMKHTPKPGSAK